MRQFSRMCKANAGCINCPLHQMDSCADECSIGAFVLNTADIERKVMSWAAEHPEPVYPTWCEWLVDAGLIVKSGDAYAFLFGNAMKPIPAEIAEKLGIQPKEPTP